MSTCWQCESCDLINNPYSNTCQACFNQPPKRHSIRLSRLHSRISSTSLQLKHILVYGYCKNATMSIVPLDIIKMCLLYYDEAIYWKVDSNELKSYYDTDIVVEKRNNNTNDQLYGDIFYINNIKCQCSIHPEKENNYKYTAFYLNALLPTNVESICFYTEVVCEQNNAEFKRAVNFSNNKTYSLTDSIWKHQEYLLLNVGELINNHKQLFFGCYFEILSIKYNDKTEAFYKPIFMKRQTEYKWNIDNKFLKTLRNAKKTQLFISDTFDEVNNNWGLWILPMGIIDVELEKRNVCLKLNLYKKPLEIKELTVKCTITNNYNNTTSERLLYFDQVWTVCDLPIVFKSTVLYEIDTLVLTCRLCIEQIQFHDNYDANTQSIIQ